MLTTPVEGTGQGLVKPRQLFASQRKLLLVAPTASGGHPLNHLNQLPFLTVAARRSSAISTSFLLPMKRGKRS